MSANDRQVAGNHYRQVVGEQHWDRVHRLRLDYFQAAITKYVERWKAKNGLQDLLKAQHFLQKYIELVIAEIESEQLANLVAEAVGNTFGKQVEQPAPITEEPALTEVVTKEELGDLRQQAKLYQRGYELLGAYSDDNYLSMCKGIGEEQLDKETELTVLKDRLSTSVPPSPQIIVGPDNLCRCVGTICLADGNSRKEGMCHIEWLDRNGVKFIRTNVAKES